MNGGRKWRRGGELKADTKGGEKKGRNERTNMGPNDSKDVRRKEERRKQKQKGCKGKEGSKRKTGSKERREGRKR